MKTKKIAIVVIHNDTKELIDIFNTSNVNKVKKMFIDEFDSEMYSKKEALNRIEDIYSFIKTEIKSC